MWRNNLLLNTETSSTPSIQGWQDEVRRISNENGKFYGDLMGDFDSKLSGYGISLIKNELSVRVNKKHEVGVGGKNQND